MLVQGSKLAILDYPKSHATKTCADLKLFTLYVLGQPPKEIVGITYTLLFRQTFQPTQKKLVGG